jgi:hypothetical protein
MSGQRPFFLTGANAKIKVNNKTLAYATNMSYSISVNHASPVVLGMYEPTSIEPLSYVVSGQFTVIRYVADIKNEGVKNIADSSTGNGIGNWKSFGSPTKDPGKYITDSRTNESLNPGKLDQAIGFDIQIYQGSTSVAKIRNARITKADFNISIDNLAHQTFSFSAIYADEDSFLADFSGRGQQFE